MNSTHIRSKTLHLTSNAHYLLKVISKQNETVNQHSIELNK